MCLRYKLVYNVGDEPIFRRIILIYVFLLLSLLVAPHREFAFSVSCSSFLFLVDCVECVHTRLPSFPNGSLLLTLDYIFRIYALPKM